MRTKAATARRVVVLIASKQEWTSRSLESILVPKGYAVVKTYTRAQALQHALADPPDAIVIDEQLTDGDGHELCRELRARAVITPTTPVFISLPRSPTRRDRLAALDARAWACLGTPLDAEELLALLNVYVPAKLEADRARTDGLVDEMTGVYNVRGLTRRSQELAAHATRRNAALACVLIAPEHHSDEEGVTEAAQEALVRRVAAALKATARHSDAIGRLGRNAFAVVAVDTDDGQARKLAERLAAAILAEAPPLPRFQLRAGCHGVSDFRSGGINAAELMLRATAALEKARTNPPGDWLQGFDGGDAVALS